MGKGMKQLFKIITIIMLFAITLPLIIINNTNNTYSGENGIVFPFRVIEASAQTVNGSSWTLPRNKTIIILETWVNCPFNTPKELYDNLSKFMDIGSGFLVEDGVVFNKTVPFVQYGGTSDIYPEFEAVDEGHFGFYIQLSNGKCYIYTWVWNTSLNETASLVMNNTQQVVITPFYWLAYKEYQAF